jgi:hypothetical protein
MAKSPAQPRKRSIFAELARLINTNLTMADRDRFDREARSVRNERGAAILLAANVENSLRYAIMRRLSILGRVDNEELFSYDRPMGSFQNKIRMGYALGIIGNETKENLGIIRRIRNTFAPAASPVSFSTDCVHQACDFLVIPANYRPKRRKALSGREKYRIACEVTEHNLISWGAMFDIGLTHGTITVPLPAHSSAWAMKPPLP